MKKSVPPPPGWNKTISDLIEEMNAGVSKGFGGAEWEWARDYERSLLPADIRYPRKGDTYEALQDIEVSYLTTWNAPYAGGGKAVLKQGDRIKVDHEPIDRPIAVSAAPINYYELEERIVPSSDRNNEKYSGFYLSVKTIDLNNHFKLMDEA
jgi:hypothetical protein